MYGMEINSYFESDDYEEWAMIIGYLTVFRTCIISISKFCPFLDSAGRICNRSTSLILTILTHITLLLAPEF
jgi:hypothetical protein